MKPIHTNDPQLKIVREKLAAGDGKLLIIQTAFLGDVILTTPLLRSVRQAFPEAKIAALTIPECEDVLLGFTDKTIVFDKRQKKDRRIQWFELIQRLRSERFDVALIPHRSIRSAITARKAGIKCRIGLMRGAGAIFHTHRVPYRRGVYEGLRNLELLAPLADVDDDGLPQLHPSDGDKRKVEEILTDLGLTDDRFVVFAPGSVWLTKRWLPEYFHQLTQRLKDEFDLQVVTIGGREDEAVCSSVGIHPNYNLAGKLSILGSAALTARSKFIISGDTAPAHIATAVGTDQVIIFGSTVPRFGFAPPTPKAHIAEIDLWCRPCTNHGRRNCPLGHLKCMKNVTPDYVINLIRDQLSF